MTGDVDVAGRRIRVRTQRIGSDWKVCVDDRPEIRADIVPAGARWSLLLGSRSYEIAIEIHGNGERAMYVDGRRVHVSLPAAPARFGRRRRWNASTAAASRRVVAPMTGRIVRVLVKTGEAVTAGQPLLVVEAMKMENELRSPMDGTIADVRVREGVSIEAGTLVVILE